MFTSLLPHQHGANYFAPIEGRLSTLAGVLRARGYETAGFTSNLEAGYDNCLAYLDQHVGRLLDSLAASSQWSNTVVAITSDHGEAFGEHGALTHGTNLYREVIHVPLIIFGPGIPRGLRIGAITRLEDLFPTFLDFAARGALPFNQATLRRYWTPGFVPGSLDGLTVSELGTASYRPAPSSLVTSEWHLIRDNAGRGELYDWRLDPLEKSDLARLPEHQTLIRNLEARLRLHKGFGPALAWA